MEDKTMKEEFYKRLQEVIAECEGDGGGYIYLGIISL